MGSFEKGLKNEWSEIMKSVQEAAALVRKYLPENGGVIEDDIIADRDYPPFDRVMMDGIAVSFNIWKEGKRDFRIAGICPAGEARASLTDFSTCFEVMTGAPLPLGADLVIPYEHLTIRDGEARVTLETERTHLENVHMKGSDAKAGDVLLRAGQKINGPHRGIAASVGISEFRLTKNAHINIISTGDELVEINVIPDEHQIRRSNAYALRESLAIFGYDCVELSHLPDEISAIEEHYKTAKEKYDVLIYSGGVSKGKFDYLPETWKKLGVEEILHGISQRPGKPLWFGVDEKSETVVMGLPGNPVSSLVCLHRYFLNGKEIYAQLSEEIIFTKDLTYFVPVKIEYGRTGTLIARPLRIKNSGEFSALAGSDGFIELPAESSVFPAGEAYLFHPWRPV